MHLYGYSFTQILKHNVNFNQVDDFQAWRNLCVWESNMMFYWKDVFICCSAKFACTFAGKPWDGVEQGRGKERSPLWGLFHTAFMYFLKWSLMKREKSVEHSRHVKGWSIYYIWYSLRKWKFTGRRRKVYLASIWIQQKA